MTEQYANHSEEEALLEPTEENREADAAIGPMRKATTRIARVEAERVMQPLLERIESLERRLDELTGEADTAATDEYDSGEA